MQTVANAVRNAAAAGSDEAILEAFAELGKVGTVVNHLYMCSPVYYPHVYLSVGLSLRFCFSNVQ